MMWHNVNVTDTDRVEPKRTMRQSDCSVQFSLLRFSGKVKTGRSVMQANKSEEEQAGYPKSQNQANRVKAGQSGRNRITNAGALGKIYTTIWQGTS